MFSICQELSFAARRGWLAICLSFLNTYSINMHRKLHPHRGHIAIIVVVSSLFFIISLTSTSQKWCISKKGPIIYFGEKCSCDFCCFKQFNKKKRFKIDQQFFKLWRNTQIKIQTHIHTYIHSYISFLLRCIDLRDNSRFSHEELNLKRRCFCAKTQNILFSKRLLDTLYSSPNSLNLVSTTLNTQGLVVW